MFHLLTIIGLFSAHASSEATTRLVTVPVPEYGLVQGSLHTVRRSAAGPIALATFLGVPYAQPPLGALRFVAPRPLATDADGQRLVRALHFPPACPQRLDRAFDGIRGECLQSTLQTTEPSGAFRCCLSERLNG